MADHSPREPFSGLCADAGLGTILTDAAAGSEGRTANTNRGAIKRRSALELKGFL